MGYFQHRTSGVLVARVHGIETIREFITGAAVAVMLDYPFLLIFLSIMFYFRIYLVRKCRDSRHTGQRHHQDTHHAGVLHNF